MLRYSRDHRGLLTLHCFYFHPPPPHHQTHIPPAMDSRLGIERISVSHHLPGMRRVCHEPHNLKLMSVRMFKRARDDGIQTLLGVAGRAETGGGGGVDRAHPVQPSALMAAHPLA